MITVSNNETSDFVAAAIDTFGSVVECVFFGDELFFVGLNLDKVLFYVKTFELIDSGSVKTGFASMTVGCATTFPSCDDVKLDETTVLVTIGVIFVVVRSAVTAIPILNSNLCSEF